MSAVKGKVLSAAGLKNADLWGKSDPFVKVTLETPSGDVVSEMKTASKTDDLDPNWGDDESFNFACEDGAFLDYKLRFKIIDTGLGPDTELGEALVPLKLIPLQDEQTVFQFSLGASYGKKKSLGTITISATLIPKAGFFG
mmetsp:Transcript_97659/g.146372  ORF Transcript_97659/g.146372 Transcript_97659/m.146372 type:complete len:141 (-) Transcript_97659:77-499(-)